MDISYISYFIYNVKIHNIGNENDFVTLCITIVKDTLNDQNLFHIDFTVFVDLIFTNK